MLQMLLERAHPIREECHVGQVRRPLSMLFRRLYQTCFWTFFAASSGLFFLGAFALWLLTLPFDRNGRLLHLYSCFWAMTYVYLNPGWTMRFEHRDRLPWKGAAVLVSNHQSAGDILVLFGLFRPYK